jgi:hypothetical protein
MLDVFIESAGVPKLRDVDAAEGAPAGDTARPATPAEPSTPPAKP